jgi:hypothetical protein
VIDLITPKEYMNPSLPHRALARRILRNGDLNARDVFLIRRVNDAWWIAECLVRDDQGHIVQRESRTVVISYSDHQTDPR